MTHWATRCGWVTGRSWPCAILEPPHTRRGAYSSVGQSTSFTPRGPGVRVPLGPPCDVSGHSSCDVPTVLLSGRGNVSRDHVFQDLVETAPQPLVRGHDSPRPARDAQPTVWQSEHSANVSGGRRI